MWRRPSVSASRALVNMPFRSFIFLPTIGGWKRRLISGAQTERGDQSAGSREKVVIENQPLARIRDLFLGLRRSRNQPKRPLTGPILSARTPAQKAQTSRVLIDICFQVLELPNLRNVNPMDFCYLRLVNFSTTPPPLNSGDLWIGGQPGHVTGARSTALAMAGNKSVLVVKKPTFCAGKGD